MREQKLLVMNVWDKTMGKVLPIRIVLFVFFIASGLYSQNIIERPYDWSGQYGSSIVNGRLFWNSDWTSGPLLFDGSYTFYSQRYGDQIISRFALLTSNQIPKFTYQTQDTSLIKSALDYKIGDYNYDQLAINIGFNKPNRYVKLHGFKRSYAGREGQFFHPDGMTVPMQQTYILEYGSEYNGWSLDAAAARLVTESGLPDTSFSKGLFEDEILTAGILTKSPGDNIQLTSHLALFQQWRRVEASWYPNWKSQYINRSRWQNQLNGFEIEGFEISFGLDLNTQSVTMVDTVYRQTNWATSFTKLKWSELSVTYGGSFFDKGGTSRYIAAEYLKSWKYLSINAKYSDQFKPTHFSIWEANHRNNLEKVILADFSAMADFKYGKTGLHYYQGASFINNLKKGDYSTIEFVGQFNLLKYMSFKGSYSIQNGNYYLSDGIGNRLFFQLNFEKERFFNRFDLSAKLFGEGLLNRKGPDLLSPLDGVPMEPSTASVNLTDIWLLHFDVSATISSMTITWSVRNILQAIEPNALKMFPDKEVGDFLVQYNSTYPPMGRLIMFSIFWTFKD
ncbi:MAG: hypothetical protein ACE5D0_04440 [Fidelibacterota bacterium]